VLNVHEKFVVPIIDLATKNERYAGIYVPEPEIGSKNIGITDQFLENAETYHNRYANTAHWLQIFNRIFDRVGKPPGDRLDILDIGTGSGVNTVVPLLSLFPGCSIVGTDLSPQLLAMLRRHVVMSGLDDQVACVCTDAMRNFFKPESVDLVVGGSILHHLIDPQSAIVAARCALKPGGMAIFVEPFEGYSIIRAAFDLITARSVQEALALGPTATSFMRTMMRDYEVRAGSDKNGEIYQYLDDKWLFTRSYIQDVAGKAGFKSVVIVPMYETGRQYRQGMTSILRMGSIDPETDIPSWAWEIIDTFDRCFSDDLKTEVTLESGIVFMR
jgi:ubiquinone/menaquinone biosynthesis C-methylase UbiE